jgi:hypothetical protein
MGFGDLRACSIQLESSHLAGSNVIEHVMIAINPKFHSPPILSPNISLYEGISMGFSLITACSILLEFSHRASSNGIEYIAIAPKLNILHPTKPFPLYIYILG